MMSLQADILLFSYQQIGVLFLDTRLNLMRRSKLSVISMSMLNLLVSSIIDRSIVIVTFYLFQEAKVILFFKVSN